MVVVMHEIGVEQGGCECGDPTATEPDAKDAKPRKGHDAEPRAEEALPSPGPQAGAFGLAEFEAVELDFSDETDADENFVVGDISKFIIGDFTENPGSLRNDQDELSGTNTSTEKVEGKYYRRSGRRSGDGSGGWGRRFSLESIGSFGSMGSFGSLLSMGAELQRSWTRQLDDIQKSDGLGKKLRKLFSGFMVIFAVAMVSTGRFLVFKWASMEMEHGAPVVVTPLFAATALCIGQMLYIWRRYGWRAVTGSFSRRYWPMALGAVFNALGPIVIYIALLDGDATGVVVMLQTASVMVVPMTACMTKKLPSPTQTLLMIIVAASGSNYPLVTGGTVSLSLGVASLAFFGQVLFVCGNVSFEFVSARATVIAKAEKSPVALVPVQTCVMNDCFRVIYCLGLLWLLDYDRVVLHPSEMLAAPYICMALVGAFSSWVYNVVPAVFGAMRSTMGASITPLFVYAAEALVLRPRPADMSEILVLLVLVCAALGGDILAMEVRSSVTKAQIEALQSGVALVEETRKSRHSRHQV